MAAILILEDRAVDRKFLAMLLKSAGHVVNEASDGAEGLRLAERTPPDPVISRGQKGESDRVSSD